MSSGTYGEYGALIVCGDYKGKLNAIAKVLNRFEYDQGDERLRFVVHNGRIEPNNFGNETMSAFPLRLWLKSEDGRRIPGDEQCDHEDGGWEIDDYEEVSLEELSKTIAPLLTCGTLELVSIRHYKTRFILFHTLAIRSDGWAQRQSQEYESFQRRKWHTHSAATFEPPKLFPPHRSNWTILNFGRYKNKMTLPQVVLHDPDYFFRATDTHAFHKAGFPEAYGLAGKARHIKIPKPDAENWSVKYDFEPGTGKFRGFTLVQGATAVEIPGMPGMTREPCKKLDLSIVCRRKRHDKIENEYLLRDFKLHYFGNSACETVEGAM